MTKLNRIDKYLDRSDWTVKENSNMGYSLQGLNLRITESETSKYWLNEVYPADIKEAHESGDMHIHNLSGLCGYCTGWSLLDLLKEGFGGVRGKIESLPARHFKVALLQIVNFLYTISGESSGAVAFSNVDSLLAPFIREDNLSYEEVKQSLQEFLFNVNVPTRVGFQQPFTGITLDLTVPEHLKKLPAIVGGKPLDYVYGDLQKEVDLFNKALAETMLEGDGAGRPFPFPICTYSLTDDFDWENENYKPIWECAAKFGLPTFSNFIGSDMDPSDVQAMCCNLRLDKSELKKRGGGLFSSYSKTGSVGIVTINLPRIGIESDSPGEFFERLTSIMWKAHESLEIKREFIERLTDQGMYPYSAHYLRDVKEATGKYWSNHFNTIGITGANDAIFNLFGSDISSDEGKEFAIDILMHMRDVLTSIQRKTGNLYNLEASPAESASFKLALKDEKKYPGINFYNIAFNGGSVPRYTNSTHLPVGHGMNLFDMLDHQDELQSLYTGGTSVMVLLGERAPNAESVKKLIKKIATSYSIPYFSITTTFSICKNHGYISGEHIYCPECNEKTEIYSRVVGYISPLERWNDAKVSEFFERTLYTIGNDGEPEKQD